ncbi:hypothetical protein [Streptomyces sp. NRRL S-340]|uniref:hypothetical protein n=1 Tax=Streptomyces sp. NRRL S-340 TaxID=1463901 RepID=UPI0005694DDD|nr:hypothetical protein [Streptomyces sp. NRRL S-340]
MHGHDGGNGDASQPHEGSPGDRTATGGSDRVGGHGITHGWPGARLRKGRGDGDGAATAAPGEWSGDAAPAEPGLREVRAVLTGTGARSTVEGGPGRLAAQGLRHFGGAVLDVQGRRHFDGAGFDLQAAPLRRLPRAAAGARPDGDAPLWLRPPPGPCTARVRHSAGTGR